MAVYGTIEKSYDTLINKVTENGSLCKCFLAIQIVGKLAALNTQEHIFVFYDESQFEGW